MIRLYKSGQMIRVGATAVVMCMMLGWNLEARECVDPYDTECGYAPFPNDYIVVQPDEDWHRPNSHGSREDEDWRWNINGEFGDEALQDDRE